MDKKRIAFLKAREKISYKATNLDKLIFRFFGKKVISMDFEGDIGCKITAYQYRGNTIIFDIEYFNAKTSPTV